MKIHIIGGSITGCIAAEMLSKYFDDITIIEKDSFIPDSSKRKYVPHENHAHILLKKGMELLEKIFPGIIDELNIKGAPYSNLGEDIDWFQYGSWKIKYKSKYRICFSTRILLDSVIRQRILKNNKIKVKDNTSVEKMIVNKNKVTSLSIRESNNTQVIFSDLVIDSSGFGSKTDKMLTDSGISKVESTIIKKHLKYVSRIYKIPSNLVKEYKNKAIIIWSSNDNCNIGLLLPVENECCIVSVGSCFSQEPKPDEESYLSFIKNLPSEKIYNTVKKLEPISDIYYFKYIGSTWKHYEKLHDFPSGLIVLGSALCGMNPFYGQGITMSLSQIRILENNITKLKNAQNTVLIQKKIAKSLKTPWEVSKTEDFRHQKFHKQVTITMKFLQWYSKEFSIFANNNLFAREVQHKVAHFISSPIAIFHPKILMGMCIKKIITKRK
ncbi:FAD-dependent monooxygenase [Providencia rettgeri]